MVRKKKVNIEQVFRHKWILVRSLRSSFSLIHISIVAKQLFCVIVLPQTSSNLSLATAA